MGVPDDVMVDAPGSGTHEEHPEQPAAPVPDEETDVLEEPTDMEHMKALGDKEKALIPMLVSVLEALVERNDKFNSGASQGASLVTAFHALKAPACTVGEYVERIRKYSACSPCCFVTGLVYMDRYMQRNPGFALSSLSVHRLLLTCVLLSAKFLDDFYYNNAFWSKVGGVPVQELNSLELHLLFKLNFDLHVRPAEYIRYRKTLIQSQGFGAAVKVAPPVSKLTCQDEIAQVEGQVEKYRSVDAQMGEVQ